MHVAYEYMLMHTHMHVSTLTSLYESEWKPEVDITCLPWLLSLLFEIRYLNLPGAHQFV